MSLQLYTPALDDAFNNLINSIKGLTDTLSRGSTGPYLTPPQTPGRGRINASEVVVASPYFTRNGTGKRDRSPSPPPRKKKSRKTVATSSVRQGQKALDAVETSVTSTYVPPTPESEKVLSTPVRRHKRSKEHHIVTSPYFAGSVEAASDLGPSKPKRRKRAVAAVEEPVIPVIDPPERWWKTEALPVKDTISLAYFKAHSVLYYQLWLAKPVLIQERVSDNPWKLLIAVMLLNKTSGTVAIPIFWEILERWPTPLVLSQADESELMAVIRSLGLQRTRSKRLILLSKMYLDDPPAPDSLRPSSFKIFGEWYKPTPVSHLPGTGAYALDSYRIFYSGDGHDPQEWKSVMPSDKELIRHLRWKWAFEERKKWGPDSGVTGDVDTGYLERLPYLLQK